MIFQYLEQGFLIAVVACVVFAAARVRTGPPEMLLQRICFLLAVFACIVLAAAFVQWNAEMEVGDRGWNIQLGFAPLWNPPPLPAYSRFSESYSAFGDDFEVPQKETPGSTITRYPILEGIVGNLFFYLWSVLFFFGVLYFVTRGEKRDPLFHYGVGIWFGVTAAGLIYLAFSIIRPDEPARRELFGYAGVLGGILVAARTWRRIKAPAYTDPTDGKTSNSD
jgi:hypothetical protein